jgi:arylsulfatase A-like enzyme
MSAAGGTYFLAVCFWVVTALYGVLSSQAFIQEQFLEPRLFDPLATFADKHALFGAILLGGWIAARLRTTTRRASRWTWAIAIVWVAVLTSLAIATPLARPHSTPEALVIVGAGISLVFLLAAAELPTVGGSRWAAAAGNDMPRDRCRADLAACLLAATGVTLAHAIGSAWVDGISVISPADALQAIRLNLLFAAAAFLAIAAIRGAAGLTSRPVLAELVLSGIAMAALLTIFISTVFLASISIRGVLATAIGLGFGASLASAVAVRAGAADGLDDGVARVLRPLSPQVTARWWGLALWVACLAVFAIAIAAVSRTGDWNFVLLRSGIALSWLLALSAALAFTRRVADGGARLSFAVVAMVLGVHLAVETSLAPVHASAMRNPSGKWLAEMLEGDVLTENGTDLVPLLHAHTNIPRTTQVSAVDVDLARLTGDPAPDRPHVFMFVVDSLRRDYLSPYNPAAAFTPHIDAFAQDSLVFRNAFTQYGATGLSIPSIWVGGPILHKQYVASFPRMNTLAKLLAQEQYDQWIGMDHIMETILPPSDRRSPIDAGVPVKDFRLCSTLTEIRNRLSQRPPDAPPVFAYSLPQDVHVSVINREGTRSIDEAAYGSFHAPVASRVRRLDKCLGEFISDLKARDLYDRSVIILTSDHGDSLGEQGRMGHAYSLHPEIVRVPLIVHVPPALREAWTWNDQRPAYTTDITPTLYRLLGHEPSAPSTFFGEPLAQRPGAPPPARDRMVAASYGAVYGALMHGATRYYVFDAIAMREMAFELGSGLEQRQVPVTADMQEQGMAVIRDTVEAIGTFYRFATVPGSEP